MNTPLPARPSQPLAADARDPGSPKPYWTMGAPWLATAALVLALQQSTWSWDEWDWAAWWLRVRTTGLDLPALWLQHNEHRPVLLRWLFYWTCELGLSPITLMLVSLGAFGATLALLKPLIVDAGSSLRRGARTILQLAASAFFLSWIQWENLLVGGQVCFAGALLGAVLVARGLSAAPGRRASVWILGGLAVAYLSTAHWVVLIPLIVARSTISWYRSERTRFGWLAPLAAAAGLLALLSFYLVDFIPPAHHPRPAYGVRQAWDMVGFLLLFYGNPFANGTLVLPKLMGAVFVLGSGIVAGLAATGRFPRRAPSTAAFALWLLALAHGTALLIAIGRAGLGQAAALSSRYASVMLVGWVALLCTGLDLLRQRRQEAPAAGSERRSAALAGLLVGLPLGMGLAISAAKLYQVATWTMPQRAAAERCLEEVLADPELLGSRWSCLQTLYPDPARLVGIARQLRER